MPMLRVALIVALMLATPVLAQEQAPRGPERFLPEMEAFATADRQAPPAPCGFLFVGSSSIRFWRTLQADMAPYPVINRGFGGSTVADEPLLRPGGAAVPPAGDRLLRGRERPLGRQDAGGGDRRLQPVPGAEDRRAWRCAGLLCHREALEAAVGTVRPQAELNDAVRRMAGQRRDLTVIDVVGPMLKDGRPRDIFVEDDLHMTPAGYVIWTEVIRPVVAREAARPTSCKTA